jgi:hypothetical protein
MTQSKISKELFKRAIKRREENTETLEKKEKGDFKVKRFMPLNEKGETPQSPVATTDTESAT